MCEPVRGGSVAGMSITCENLTKRFGSTVVVDRLSFDVHAGQVTGLLGPNGAGKSTTIRMILGLDTPSAGRALLVGQPYRTLSRPLCTVGALLDAGAVHPGRSASAHLAWLAATAALPRRRIAEVLDLTGLTAVAGKRVGSFSLGMRQRLGIAAALLGDPPIVVFDEPVNGLDPEGIIWVRTLMRELAAGGRTVFVSSHLMSEMALTADHLIVLGRGRLIANASMTDFIATSAPGDVLLRSPHRDRLGSLLTNAGAVVQTEADDCLAVSGLALEAISELAAAHQVSVYELRQRTASLEDAYLTLTQDAIDFRSLSTERSA